MSMTKKTANTSKSSLSEARQVESNWKRTFFLIWTGQAFSLLGSSLVQFALVWWLTQKTGSATVLAAATFVALLPPFSWVRLSALWWTGGTAAS